MSSLFESEIRTAVDLLQSQGVHFEPGLTDQEVEQTETTFGFRFPPDLRAFLQTALPASTKTAGNRQPFPDWRAGNQSDLQKRFDWPWEGMVFDIEHNAFWLDEWGKKPDVLQAAMEVAHRYVSQAPTLIPVYGHRYIPAAPREAGNPVFSVHQTDIIYYGQNLWDYFEQEFGEHEEGWYAGERYAEFTEAQYVAAHRDIPFWSRLVS
ncbi:SMI1/KNR4 family protein [Gimesia sp.]|uniref:SMI1/KNR4 family protein n=1 Tax=Gimesia sp. TaxID=2024833 RepID=UPI003A91C821